MIKLSIILLTYSLLQFILKGADYIASALFLLSCAASILLLHFKNMPLAISVLVLGFVISVMLNLRIKESKC